jgi:NADPH:quinone reductase-like Zn-dependent oxidoreductase
LVYEEAPVTLLEPGDALVRVHATGITPTELSWSATYTTRDGVDRLPVVPGHDVSEVVEAVCPGVTAVKIGDEVYGLTDFWRDGAAAEFVAVRAADLAPKPSSLDHLQSAAVPLSALTAWQGLFDQAGLQSGQRLLIHGAAGGVGTYAVQFAKWRGAQVLATASASQSAFLRDLGVDDLIDYTEKRFEDEVREVDVVLDTIGGETLEQSWSVLRPGGVLVTLVGNITEDRPKGHGVRGIFFIVTPNRAQLIEIARLIDQGQVHPVIQAILPLNQTREAFEQGLKGHNRGKIVLRVAE